MLLLGVNYLYFSFFPAINSYSLDLVKTLIEESQKQENWLFYRVSTKIYAFTRGCVIEVQFLIFF